MNISIVGTGYVGLVSGTCFSELGLNVVCVDVNKQKIEDLKNGIIPIYEPGLERMLMRNVAADRLRFTTSLKNVLDDVDVIFIAVGTPPGEDGSADMRYVIEVAKTIGENINSYKLVVVKSTVPVGTSERVRTAIQNELDKRNVKIDFDVASNPEFLKEGNAINDFMKPDRVVVGVDSEKAKELMTNIYRSMMLNNFRVIFMDIPSAEMTKYASNAMLATRISFMNDIANLCELVGADIEDVAKGMSYDERIGRKFLNAGIGSGGSCFPKDTKALEYLAKQNSYKLRTVKAAVDVNKDQKTMLYKKASRRLITFNDLKVAILGLTFKPGTDDLREAPSLENVPLLLEHGAKIYAYDPVGKDNFKKKFPEGKNRQGSIKYVDHIEEALKEANVCFIFTEWDEIRAITPKQYKKLMRTPLVYDGRNVYDIKEMKVAGIEYYSIGRPCTKFYKAASEAAATNN